MQRNESSKLTVAWNVGTLVCVILSLVGCISTQTSIKESQVPKTYRLVPLRDSENPEIVYSTIAIIDETYLESLNREMKEKYAPRRRLKRHIGFFGYLKEFEKEIGVKVVIPF